MIIPSPVSANALVKIECAVLHYLKPTQPVRRNLDVYIIKAEKFTITKAYRK